MIRARELGGGMNNTPVPELRGGAELQSITPSVSSGNFSPATIIFAKPNAP